MTMQIGNQSHSVSQESVSLIHCEMVQNFLEQKSKTDSEISLLSLKPVALSLTEPEVPAATAHDMYGLMSMTGTTPAASPSDVLSFPQMPTSPLSPQGPFVENNGIGTGFVDLMAEIQSTLSMTGFWIKQVARFQGLAYGLAAADSLDKKAVQIEKGATDKLIGGIIAGVVQIAVAIVVVKYSWDQMRSIRDTRARSTANNSTSASASLTPNGISGTGSNTRGRVQTADEGAESAQDSANVAAKKAAARQAAQESVERQGESRSLTGGALDRRREPDIGVDTDTNNDVQVTGAVANALLQVGSAASSISNNIGEFMASKHEAEQVRLDADSTRYQTFSQAEERFLSAGEKFAEDSLNTLNSIMQKVYDLNSQITQAFPR
ncbi:MAG: hypothetical protein V4629_10810 [Pseudomonadota bacterium]